MTNLKKVISAKSLNKKVFSGWGGRGGPPPAIKAILCPAERASYAEGGHFVTCISPSGLAPVGRLERISTPTIGRPEAKPVYPPRSGRRPRRAFFFCGFSFIPRERSEPRGRGLRKMRDEDGCEEDGFSLHPTPPYPLLRASGDTTAAPTCSPSSQSRPAPARWSR
jgi:hypothetical protein